MSNKNFEGFAKAEIVSAVMTSLGSGRTVDFKKGISKLEYYASVFDPTVAAIVRVVDSATQLYQLPLSGEEVVELEFKSHDKESITKVLAVTKVEDLSFDSNGSCTAMTIHLMNIDELLALGKSVYKGAKDQISGIAKAILQEYLKPEANTKLNIEDTQGIESLVIPGWNVWDTMQFLRRRAVSKKYKSPYLFFEGNEGYHFLSIEELIDQRTKGDITTYHQDPYNVENSLTPGSPTFNAKQRHIMEDLQIIRKVSAAEQMMNGGAKTTVRTFNMLKKEATDASTDYTELNSLLRKTPDDKFHSAHSEKIKSLLGNNASKDIILVVDDANQNSQATNFGSGNIIAKAFGEVELGFMTYGDTELDVGDVIRLEMPRTTDMQTEDMQMTGNYMVTNLAHHFSDDQLMTSVEVARIGFGSKVF